MYHSASSLSSLRQAIPLYHALLMGCLIVGTAAGIYPETQNPPGETRPNVEQQLLEQRETREDLTSGCGTCCLRTAIPGRKRPASRGYPSRKQRPPPGAPDRLPTPERIPFLEAHRSASIPRRPASPHRLLEGAVDPIRATKASVFLPWDPAILRGDRFAGSHFPRKGSDLPGAHAHPHRLGSAEPPATVP